MPAQLIDALRTYYEQGGFVMPPLIAAAFSLWYALGYRMATLRRGSAKGLRSLVTLYRGGSKRSPRGIIDAAVVDALRLARDGGGRLRPRLEDAHGHIRKELKRGRTLIRSIVGAAPLAGLLGTVTGMIETFDSLADAALFTQTGGIAAGIAQALFTTQMGLAVAVPGLIAGQLLDRRQQRFEQELSQLSDMLCGADPLQAARA
ncbi:MAG: MotA/TolQ/ExbB proton channel family protein [Proteobacteria bacterium]|nr:MotA/TolQ/ExbB proton channel family protein [Pseudomonadota bacterium]